MGNKQTFKASKWEKQVTKYMEAREAFNFILFSKRFPQDAPSGDREEGHERVRCHKKILVSTHLVNSMWASCCQSNPHLYLLQSTEKVECFFL